MPRETVVEIGDVQFTLKAVPIRQAKEWRAKLGGPFATIMSVLGQADEIKITNPEDLAGLFQVVQTVLIGAPEMIFGLLCEYSPEIAAEREALEEVGYDEEIFEAFMEAVKLVYPFGVFTQLVGGKPKAPKPSRRGRKKPTT